MLFRSALGENVVEICRQACKAAKAHGVKISCDLNYRGKLWTRDQAREAMTKLCEYVDVCISNEEDAKDVFGIEAEATDIYGGKLNAEGYKSVDWLLLDYPKHRALQNYFKKINEFYKANPAFCNFQRNFSTGEVEVVESAIYHKTEYRERRVRISRGCPASVKRCSIK